MAITTHRMILVECRIGFPLTILVATAVPGCATQTMNPTSANQGGNQATISADSKNWSYSLLPGSQVGVTIDNVDGQKVGAGTYQASVDPGRHTLSLTCQAMGLYNTEDLSIDVSAGTQYAMSAIIGGQRPVPCTSNIRRKSDDRPVPIRYIVDSDGLYRFKEQRIAVRPPKDCIEDLAIYSGDRSVDFVTNNRDWFTNGEYRIELMKIPSSVTNDFSFIREIEPDAKDYVDERPRSRLNLVLKEAKRFDVDDRAGYRVVAATDGKWVFIATFVLQRSWITVASLMYPLVLRDDALQAVPWNCYNKFVESVKQVQ